MAADPAAVTRDLFAALSVGYPGPFAVRLWDGSTWRSGPDPPAFTFVLKHPGAARAMFWPFSKVGFGESYIFDDFDVEGDVFALTGWLRHLVARQDRSRLGDKIRLLRALFRLPNQKNPRLAAPAGRPRTAGQGAEADRRGISLHYDRPSEFYRLFLGPTMQYTCSYFHHPDEDLDESQWRKMDYICRKLRLRPGQRLLDVGCGWGGLLRHAVEHFGVTGVGVTLSGEQSKWAERANQQAGLGDRIRITYCDYREMTFDGEFDAVSSVGMTEEVGRANLPVYLRQVWRALRPGGVYLHHAITLRPNTPFPRWTPFARKYVFPNGDLQTILFVLTAAADAGFEIRDVENLREHYVLTLENWVRRLEANRAAAIERTDEVTYRIYRIYMAGATMGFRSGVYNLNQCLLAKPHADGSSGLPLTRAAWYA